LAERALQEIKATDGIELSP